jgi:hypothetical protein
MIGTLVLFPMDIFPGNFVDDERVFDTNPFDHPFGDHFLAIPVVKLILDGRTAAV